MLTILRSTGFWTVTMLLRSVWQPLLGWVWVLLHNRLLLRVEINHGEDLNLSFYGGLQGTCHDRSGPFIRVYLHPPDSEQHFHSLYLHFPGWLYGTEPHDPSLKWPCIIYLGELDGGRNWPKHKMEVLYLSWLAKLLTVIAVLAWQLGESPKKLILCIH